MTLYGTIPITWVDWTHPVKGGTIKKDPKLEGGRKVKIDLEEERSWE